METHFRLKHYPKAYQYGLKLVDLKYPNDNKAQRIVIHVALAAEMYTKAQNHVKDYLRFWPKDEMMTHLYERLSSGTDLRELKSLFETGE